MDNIYLVYSSYAAGKKKLNLRIFNLLAVTHIFWFSLAVAIIVASDKCPVNLGSRIAPGNAPVKISLSTVGPDGILAR